MNPMSNQTIANAQHREYESHYGTPNHLQTSPGRSVSVIMAALTCILAAAGLFF